MASNRIRRVTKELADLAADKETRIFAEAAGGSDLTHLRATFPGPPDTPYEGGTYVVDIQIPQEYPFKPPKMRFHTKLWHPNVSSQTGAICLDILDKNWSPVITIKAALLSLQALLENPVPTDPQDAEVATMMIKHPEQFGKVAREWAIKHASAPQNTNWDKTVAHNLTPTKPKSQKLLSREEELRQEILRYQGYNKDLIDRFVMMGFDVERVVDAFNFVNIDRNNGEDYELEEAYMGDITARLLGEP